MSIASGHASLIGATFGSYQVQSLVGRGAMGTVYLARDTTLKRYVALKVLLGHLARNPLLVRRFHREAQATAKLRHPNIVRIYAAGVEAGTPYIAMEYVEGEPLDRFLRRYGQLEWQRALHIGEQVAEALAAAHAEGITHRDVKPANIMLDMQGRVRLTDFGIAHVHTERGDSAPEESFVGTPRYMSPEQCANRDITASTDLFSLGIVLYEMIAGEQPFQGESAVALIKRITNDEPPRLNKIRPEVPDDVARLVAHLLEKRPNDRPANARDVVRRIDALQAENGGRSAMPDALTAFIRDQAQPRTLPTSAPAQPATARERTPAETAPRRWRFGWRIAVSAAVLVAAALLPQGWLLLRDDAVAAYTVPTIASERSLTGGMSRVAVPIADFDISAMEWTPDNTHVVIWLHGRVGSRVHGTEGILRLNVDSGEVASIKAPDALAGVLSSDRIRIASRTLSSGDPETLFFAGPSADGARRMLAYDMDDARPQTAWIVSGEAEAPLPWAGIVGAIHPDGDVYCTTDGDRLIEIELTPMRTTPRALVDAIGEIDTIRYAPDGDTIAYLERIGPHDVWLTTVHGTNEAPPQRIAPVLASSDISFSPDGRNIVFTADDGVLKVADLFKGHIIDLTPGRVSPSAWHPSGAYVAALATDGGQQEIVIAETSGARRLHTLPGPDAPLSYPPVVSPDGTRVAVAAASPRGMEFFIMTLDSRTGARATER